MIKFMRDKDGNLYAVKDGQVISRVNAFGDEKFKEKKEDGNGKRGKIYR